MQPEAPGTPTQPLLPPPGMPAAQASGTSVIPANVANEIEGMVQRQMHSSMHLLAQMMAAAQRSPPQNPLAPMVQDPPSIMQILQRSAGSGSFRLGQTPGDSVPRYPSSIDEWSRRIEPIINKRVWSMGDMIAATMGYLSCQNVHNMDVAFMVVDKIREMSATEYGPVFEGMINASDPQAFWAELVVGPASRFGRAVERRPFSYPRSSSPKGEQPKSVPVKKEKK